MKIVFVLEIGYYEIVFAIYLLMIL